VIKSHDILLSRLLPVGADSALNPRLYLDLLSALWANKQHLSSAWTILTRGVCDGCSLGSHGMRNIVLGSLHLCPNRFRSLRWNTMGPLRSSALENVTRLQALSAEKIRSLGRLAHPIIRRKNDRGFSKTSWPQAFEIVRNALRDTAPHELGFCAASHGITNEAYYVFQKLARALGTNNIDLCFRQRHAADLSGLRSTLGSGAATCSLADLMETDLLVILESGVVALQPAVAKYLRYAKTRGTRIIALKPVREQQLQEFPSVSPSLCPESGAQLTDEVFTVRAGGQVAFVNGVLKALIEGRRVDREFVARHTRAFDELANAVREQSWELLEQRSGAPRQRMERFATLYGYVNSAVFLYGAKPAPSDFAAEDVRAIVNLALARGMLGRENCGILPIRYPGWSQGGSDCGAEPDQFPGGFPVNDESARLFSNLWRHPVSSAPGLPFAEMMHAAHHGRIKLLYFIGGSFFEDWPDAQGVMEAFSRVPLRIYQDVMLSPALLLDGAEIVLVLPTQTPYEQHGGSTTTSLERKVFFTPQIARRIGESLPGWQIPTMIGRYAMSNGDLLFPFPDAQTVREEMARVMPIYRGIEELSKEGDYFQWGGPQLFTRGIFRGMADERAVFSVLEPPATEPGKHRLDSALAGGSEVHTPRREHSIRSQK